MATCRHKVGLLSLRDCGYPAGSKCSLCNRPVCGEHRKTVSDIKGALCVECYLERVDRRRAVREDENIGRYYHRSSMYNSSGYHPYYYGDSRHYKHDHYYRDFDRTTGAEHASVEDVMDAEDFQES